MSTFLGKIAIITGAARGIGRTTAQRFAEEGCSVVITDINKEGLQETAQLITAAGGQALDFHADITKLNEIDNLISATINKYGVPDILVNNAGIFLGGAFDEITLEDWQKTMDVNLTSVFLLSRQVVRCWLANQKAGTVVNLASLVLDTVLLNSGDYIASKCGVEGLTRVIAREYADRGIRANAVAPGIVETEMSKGALANPDVRADWDRHFILGRPGQPLDIAEAVLFLASDASHYITGQTLFVDGGWRL